MSSNIKDLTAEALQLYVQIKSDTEKLKKLKEKILEKTSDDTKSISVQDSFLQIYKSKEGFRYLLNKEFDKLSEAKQKELYDTGLLKVYYKVNPEKYKQANAMNIKNELDQYVEKREKTKRRIAIFLGKESKEKLLHGEGLSQDHLESLEEQVLELEQELEELRESGVSGFYDPLIN